SGDLEDDDSALVALALGLDVGVVAGVALAPKVDWSARRARFVAAGTVLGAGAGLSLGAMITGDNKDPRALGTAALAGLWGGFLGAVAMTSDWEPDPRFLGDKAPPASPAGSPPATPSDPARSPSTDPAAPESPATTSPPPPAPAASYTVVPAVSQDSFGLAIAGTF